MEALPLIYILGSVLLNVVGICANSILIYLVTRKTSKILRNYSILILNCAVFDLIACVSSLFVIERLIPNQMGYFFLSYGPCRLVGVNACYYGFTIMLHCIPHGLYSLLYSICYRYYILSYDQPKILTISVTIAAIYTISLFQLVLTHITLSPEETVRETFAKVYKYDISNEYISGNLNPSNWKAVFLSLNTSSSVFLVFIAILIMRKLIVRKLNGAQSMAEKTRTMHAQLLKAITYQACLPLFILFGTTVYLLEQYNIYNHPIFEYTPYLLTACIPALSPMISLYFIRPYRAWINFILMKRTPVKIIAMSVSAIADRVA